MNRSCGNCTLCCKLLPVREIGKPAGRRCEYQRHGNGCTIYARRPRSCRAWSCRWLLADPGTEDLSRPDRANYVIDPMPDFVRLTDNDTGAVTELPVIQVWLDANYPDAHRDPALRDYLQAEAARTGMAALLRVAGNDDAFALFAPAISADHEWHEMRTNFKPEMQHTQGDIARVMKERGLGIKIAMSND